MDKCAEKVQGPGDTRQALLGIVDRPALVITAMGASPVRLLHFMAVRAFGQRGREEMIVRAPFVLAHFGMSSFWIRHYFTPGSRPIRGDTQGHPERVGFYGLWARKSIVIAS
jgi:hypothetical protein